MTSIMVMIMIIIFFFFFHLLIQFRWFSIE